MNSFRLLPLLSAGLLICHLQNAIAQEAPPNFWTYTNRQFPYDREARMQRMSGTGVFQLRIDQKTGKVTAVAVVKSTGWKHLDQAAAATLIGWRARIPASQSTVTIPVTFLSSRP
jgi:TonB family protein